MIQYAVEEALAAGIEDMVLVTAPGKSLMEDHFGPAVELEAALAAWGKEAALQSITGDFPQPGRFAPIDFE